MKASHKFLAVVVCAALAVSLLRDSKSSNGPDDKLVKQWDAMCKIAAKNVKTPKRGVHKIFAYLGKQGPTMAKNFGDLLVTIERIKDERKHDKRAAEAGEKFRAHDERCAEVWERFGEAVEDDEGALELIDYAVQRLGRTLELIFASKETAWLPRGSWRLLHR